MIKPLPWSRLADLHLHLYGAIRYGRFLRYIQGREFDWSPYHASFEAAYGRRSPLQEVLARHSAGSSEAVQEFRSLFVFGDVDAGNFRRFQAKFDLLNAGSEYPNLLASNKLTDALRDELRFFVGGIFDGHQLDGIGYAEHRLGVDLKDRPSIPVPVARDIFTLVLDLYADANRQRFQPCLAVTLPRGDPWFYWELTKELALGDYGHVVTGIDFCFVEEGYPPKDKAEFFAAVHKFNLEHPNRALAILYHVGESFQDKSLESAIRWVQEAAELGCHRLGHAIALGVDPRLFGEHMRTESVSERLDQVAYDQRHAEGLERHGVHIDLPSLEEEKGQLASRAPYELETHTYDSRRLEQVRRRQEYAIECVRSTGAVVEVCPTSNRRIGGISDPAMHPVHRFLAKDLPFVIASDDPGIFDVTLQEEINWVVRTANLPLGMVEELAKRSWRYRSEILTGREII